MSEVNSEEMNHHIQQKEKEPSHLQANPKAALPGLFWFLVTRRGALVEEQGTAIDGTKFLCHYDREYSSMTCHINQGVEWFVRWKATAIR